MEQRSEEWFAARCGKATGSRISDVLMAKTTQGYQRYRAQLIAERLTGYVKETFTSGAMDHGTNTEPRACAMYTFATGNQVQHVGFLDNPTLPMSGVSPDGLVGETGGLEIKCPQLEEHIRVCTGGPIKKEYLSQIYWGMECTGRDWWDFVSFCPMLDDQYQFFCRRVHADPEKQRDIRDKVSSFLVSVSEGVEAMKGMTV